jgi:hypothetical protein
MDKDKLKKIAEKFNKKVEKKTKKPKLEIEEGILDDTYNIPDTGGFPMGNGQIYVANTLDKSARQVANPAQRSSILTYPGLYLGMVSEDSIMGKDYDDNGDLIDDTHIDNDDLVSSIENIVKILKDEPKKFKTMYNVFVQLIQNIDIEDLPTEARYKLCKKIMKKNSKLIDDY